MDRSVVRDGQLVDRSWVRDGQLVDRICGGGCKEYHISAGYSTGDHRGIPMLGI
jgi:hypothetical protein